MIDFIEMRDELIRKNRSRDFDRIQSFHEILGPVPAFMTQEYMKAEELLRQCQRVATD